MLQNIQQVILQLDAGLKSTVKIGPIARVGPNDLITASPELIMRINAVRSPYSRTGWFYQATRHRADVNHVFSEMDEEKHVDLRQRMVPGVGVATSRDAQSVFANKIRKRVRR